LPRPVAGLGWFACPKVMVSSPVGGFSSNRRFVDIPLKNLQNYRICHVRM